MGSETPAVAVGERVRRMLRDLGITQERLATALGMAQSQVSRRLDGQIVFDVAELDIVARLCGVQAADFLTQDVAA